MTEYYLLRIPWCSPLKSWGIRSRMKLWPEQEEGQGGWVAWGSGLCSLLPRPLPCIQAWFFSGCPQARISPPGECYPWGCWPKCACPAQGAMDLHLFLKRDLEQQQTYLWKSLVPLGMICGLTCSECLSHAPHCWEVAFQKAAEPWVLMQTVRDWTLPPPCVCHKPLQ